MKLTNNYKLKKPDIADVVDINELNSNMDIIDELAKKTEEDIKKVDNEISNTKKRADEAYSLANVAENNSSIYTDSRIKEVNFQLDDKVEVVISETNIPISKRRRGAFYCIITDKGQIVNGNIKVSPKMSLKIEK